MTTQATLYVDQGVDFLVSLELFNNEDSSNNYIITNENFYCDVKKLYSSTTIFSANIEIITLDGNNDLELRVNANQTKDLTPGKYQYDVLMSSGGITQKILEGLMIILPTVTEIGG